MTLRLRDLAWVIRSKNAGPFELTFDVLFKDAESFNLMRQKQVIRAEIIAGLYGISEEDVLGIYYFPNALAIKVTVARPLASGSWGERDVYGAQQHAPLLDYTFELDLQDKGKEVN